MEEAVLGNTGTRYFDKLVQWLGMADERKYRAAVTLLSRLGQSVTPLLVQEAIRDGKTSQHRVAILDVIQQIGGPVEMEELCCLQSLLQYRDAAVKEKVEQVIMAASPSGLPKSPEDAALMRAANPFLSVPPRGRRRRTRASDHSAALRGDQAAIKRRIKSNVAWQKREEREQDRKS